MMVGYYNCIEGVLTKVPPPPPTNDERLVILFSCGVTSFIATVLAIMENKRKWGLPVHIIYTYVAEEPLDNLRFLEHAESYFGQKVLILVNEDFNGSIYEVFNKTGWLIGPKGARCTTELKWRVRKHFVKDTDIQVFGFNAGEEKRMDDFAKNNETVNISCPLICMRYTKEDCINIASQMGVLLSESYGKGYRNANCRGCVKGQKGYWNHVRKVDIYMFYKMAYQERKMGVTINTITVNNVTKRIYLDELPPDAGKYEPLDLPDCGVLCEMEKGT